MRYALTEFPSIPEVGLKALANADIRDSDQLLEMAATPKARQIMARKLKIDEVQLSQWASLADLVRVKGVGIAFATLFVQSGLLKQVQDLVLHEGKSEQVATLLCYTSMRKKARDARHPREN